MRRSRCGRAPMTAWLAAGLVAMIVAGFADEAAIRFVHGSDHAVDPLHGLDHQYRPLAMVPGAGRAGVLRDRAGRLVGATARGQGAAVPGVRPGGLRLRLASRCPGCWSMCSRSCSAGRGRG